jgi:uncharacterized membrane protein YdbT with pleckstrin-like domain
MCMSEEIPTPSISPDFNATAITRPVPALLKYYAIICIPSFILYPVVFLVHFFKYETLRYHFDDEGIRMSWGILFKREVTLTYRRIQDIHLTRNIIERWMGLATVSIQTASGSSSPEMEIQGIPQFDDLRDFLYLKMRGAKGHAETTARPASDTSPSHADPSASADEALLLLREIRDQVQTLAARDQSGGGGRS